MVGEILRREREKQGLSIAAAVMPSSFTLATYSFILLEPSRRLYSVWTCRCTNAMKIPLSKCFLLVSIIDHDNSNRQGNQRTLYKQFYRLHRVLATLLL